MKILSHAWKASVLVALVASAVVRAGAAAPLAGERVLWLGDSITQAGGYVTFTEYYLEKQFPAERFDIVSVGRASETVSGLSEKTHPGPRPWLFERLPRAIELTAPRVVVACYGMNDGIYHPASESRLQAFQDGVRRLLLECEHVGARVILLTPPPFDRIGAKVLLPATAPDFSYRQPFEAYDKVLGDFARWEMTLPTEDATVIDLHGPIDAYLEQRRRTEPKFTFVRDGIHPNDLGHLLMAHIVLRGLGVTVPADDHLEQELKDIQADPLYALIKQQREMRSSAWLAFVGLPGAIENEEAHFAQLQAQIDAARTRP